ncbi:hypothetical protein Y032_0238g3291 [Ancylostoma ceylanicum]|uniref:Uncharacterized protein n=1 Tax=Ancylostoma ceylanicum TaxID=53326 RepID=A0A016SEI8_9BILA|nr:hypothetical protein Y032_0238g3291 [Ancylostoma ceylanicum]
MILVLSLVPGRGLLRGQRVQGLSEEPQTWTKRFGYFEAKRSNRSMHTDSMSDGSTLPVLTALHAFF